MSQDYEHYIAIREGAQIHSSDIYFDARPEVDATGQRRIFEHGFEAAYDLREKELNALREKCAELQRQLDEAAIQGEDSYVGSVEQYDGEFMMKFGDVYSDRLPNGTELYRKPFNLPSIIAQAKAEERERLALDMESIMAPEMAARIRKNF